MVRVVILLAVLTSFLEAQNNINSSATLDVNNITITFTDNGMLDGGGNCAVYWNKPADNSAIVFNHSICLSGKINNQPVVAFSQWQPVFSPGPFSTSKSVSASNLKEPAVYKLTNKNGSIAPGYTWPAELGAPVKNGLPVLYGDESIWTVFHFDTAFANTSAISAAWNEDFRPFPVEIQQLAYAHAGNASDAENILNNVLFIEWTIINKGSEQIDSFYVSVWSDIDLAPWYNNNFGVDTVSQTGFMWPGNSEIYPAAGYTLLYGPIVESPGNTAVYKGNNLDGYKNLGLSSYHPFGDDGIVSWDYNPASSTETAWNISRGLKPNGDVWTDPISGAVTKFPFAGDPASANYSWINPSTGGGAGCFIFTGPFTLAANDTQWVMIALVPGFGESSIGSVNEVKRKAEYLKNLPYEQLAFNKTSSVNNFKAVVSEFHLEQNFPNPFNPYTNFVYSIPEAIKDINVTLKIYDILGNEVAVLVNEEKSGGKYNAAFNGTGLSSGVYFAELKAGSFVSTKKITLLK